jgi:hypothetical protein
MHIKAPPPKKNSNFLSNGNCFGNLQLSSKASNTNFYFAQACDENKICAEKSFKLRPKQ